MLATVWMQATAVTSNNSYVSNKQHKRDINIMAAHDSSNVSNNRSANTCCMDAIKSRDACKKSEAGNSMEEGQLQQRQ